MGKKYIFYQGNANFVFSLFLIIIITMCISTPNQLPAATRGVLTSSRTGIKLKPKLKRCYIKAQTGAQNFQIEATNTKDLINTKQQK